MATSLDYQIDQNDGAAYPYVAPLTVTKSPPRTRSETSRLVRQSSSKSRRSSSAKSQGQISPPLTPRTSRETLPAQQGVFHNYLRAFYHFHPSSTVSSSTDESSITVSINEGDVILVHTVHPNGWADGSLLGSGARGWLPTNYCEPYDHPSIHNLLNSLTNLWDLVRDAENGNATNFIKQDYVRTIIAGVRFFLERCQCLTRESHIIQGHAGLRRMRKGLLGDLSMFVKTAKKIHEILKENPEMSAVFELMDELVLQAFRLVMRAVRFLDIFSQDTTPVPSEFTLEEKRPPTPPTDSENTQASSSIEAVSAASTTESVAGSEDHTSEWHPATPQTEAKEWSTATVCSEGSTKYPSPQLQENRYSFSSAGTSAVVKRTSLIAHRLSYTGRVVGVSRENLASERLSSAHDSFLGHLGAFIGLHLESRSSAELLSSTQQSVLACRQMLRIVQEVWERDGRQCDILAQSRDAMYDRLAELVYATKDIFAATEQSATEGLFMPDDGMKLVIAATGCVRCAGECVSRARIVIEKIGDFEYVGLGITAPPQQQHQRMASETTPIEVDKPLPATPVAETSGSAQPVSLNSKPLPLPPSPSPLLTLDIPGRTQVIESPTAPSFRSSRASLSPVPESPAPRAPKLEPSPLEVSDGASHIVKRFSVKFGYGESFNTSLSDTLSTCPNSARGDAASVLSQVSTRATTPEHSPSSRVADTTPFSSFGSGSELASVSEVCSGVEQQILTKTFVHELVYNKEGQIAGGSLPALVEQLTTHESTPDAIFVTAFYLTFRLFTTPVEFAQCLIDRFDYVGGSGDACVPVRLRVYNVFKGWLESYWQRNTDQTALGIILTFATDKLRSVLPTVGKRLAELTVKVTEIHSGALVPRLQSAVGKIASSAGDGNMPNPVISKSQLNLLKNARNGTATCSILDFDPLELARQFTIIESKIFCSIQPHELLASEWTKKVNSKAINVRAMSTLSTDLANLVADTILQLEDAKKRAILIKQWVKIGTRCLELNNYDSLMAIICSLNSSMVLRLKRTWEIVSQKTKAKLEELRAVVDVARNYAVLRQRLQNHVAPCIPFVGIYLTDLTFVDVGNQTTRQLPSDSEGDGVAVINFDKHMRTAKIISQLQGFQVPYRLVPIPEMQEWMESQIQRVRTSDQANVQSYYRRSLFLEPRDPHPPQPPSQKASPVEGATGQFPLPGGGARETPKDRFDFFLSGLHFGSAGKEKLLP